MNNRQGERRRSERLKTINLVSYRSKSDTGKTMAVGLAQTVDLSENGALIESRQALDDPHIAEFELALEDEIILLSGRVIEQTQTPDGAWLIRVDFGMLRPSIRHKLITFMMNLH